MKVWAALSGTIPSRWFYPICFTSASHVLHCPLIFLLSFLYIMVLENPLLIPVRLFMYLFSCYSLEMLKGLRYSTSVWLFILLVLGTNQELVILYLNLETMRIERMTSICWMNIWGQIWKILREKAKKTWSICNWHMVFLIENIPKGHGNWMLQQLQWNSAAQYFQQHGWSGKTQHWYL